jgi:hypothetical protein
MLSGTTFASGTKVSVPCAINPGMSSFEREVRIQMPEGGAITGLVSTSSVMEDTKRVKAVLMVYGTNDTRLLFSGQDMTPSNPAFVPIEWLKANARLER